VNLPLLSVTRATVVNRKKGEFKLSLHRTSLEQTFGLPCEAVSKPGSQDQLSSIIVSKDMPHLALMANDRLCVINGVEPRSRKEYTRIKNGSLSLSLIFRRHPSRFRDPVHQFAEIQDDVPEVEDVDLPEQCAPCGLCNVQSVGRPIAQATNDNRREGVYEYDPIGGSTKKKSPDGMSSFLSRFTVSSGLWPKHHSRSNGKAWTSSTNSNVEPLDVAPRNTLEEVDNDRAAVPGQYPATPTLLGMSEPGGMQLVLDEAPTTRQSADAHYWRSIEG